MEALYEGGVHGSGRKRVCVGDSGSTHHIFGNPEDFETLIEHSLGVPCEEDSGEGTD